MRKIRQQRERGFTLIEILIALALLAIIGAVVIPNITGYIGRGEEQAYKAEQKLIQGAVDGYYADPATRINGKKTYPLKGTTAEKQSGGLPVGDGTAWTSGSGYFIDFDTLVTGKYINSVPASASADNKALATGSYTWYVKADGTVESKYATDRATVGFVTGVYP
ncbi:MAG: prepilin-type N-terminal cleavage/methylation domain-containing protein [Chloroflexi bacterium]|nr:prepilin-type N-terminal cleavage/methylation domain-containing protein [Chloroflexota bacterium]